MERQRLTLGDMDLDNNGHPKGSAIRSALLSRSLSCWASKVSTFDRLSPAPVLSEG